MVTSTTDEHQRLVDRLYNEQPIDPLAFRQYRILSHRDFDDDHSQWIGAPILVFTERERCTLQHAAAVRFARVTGVAVVRWQARRSKWHQRPSKPQQRATALEQDPCFYEYFVENAESTLRRDVDKDMGLTKGVPVTYKSLVMKSRRQEISLERRLAAAGPGDVITLPHPPESIQVTIDKRRIPQHARREFAIWHPPNQQHSGGSNKLVTKLNQTAPNDDDGTHTIVHGGKYFKPSVAMIHPLFPVAPNFVLTVQGASQTPFDRVILALSERQDYQATRRDLYHALSRVRERRNVRLLLRGETLADKWRTLDYVRDLDSVKKSSTHRAGRLHWDKRKAAYVVK